MTDQRAIWLYAVAATNLRPSDLTEVTGVDGESVRVIESAGLTAVVGSVRLAEFGEAVLKRKLNDLDALDLIARIHHHVVDVVAHRAPTVPMRLATVYRDDAGVTGLLQERRESLAAILRSLAGRTEWGVKVFARPGMPATAERRAAESASARPGTAYLLRRREQLAAFENARRVAAESAEQVHAALTRLAVAARRHALRDSELTKEAGEMLLNGAYLVESARTKAFADEVDALADRHRSVQVVLTGPWPAYSFAAMEDSSGAGHEDGTA